MVGGIGEGIGRFIVTGLLLVVIVVSTIVWAATYYVVDNKKIIVSKPLHPKMVIKTVELECVKIIDTTYIYNIK